MGNRGRFGKYGEIKRLERLRHSGIRPSVVKMAENRVSKRDTPFQGREGVRRPFRVRGAMQSDISFLEDLAGRAFGIYGPYGEMVAQWFESPVADTLVAVAGERPVGFAMVGRGFLSPEAAVTAEVLAIAVEPRNRRMGVGGMLMGRVEGVARCLGLRRLFLHTAGENLAAQRLFMRCGYVPIQIKSRFYPEGQDAVLMMKDLP